jgi:hypothetical protein
VQGFSQSPRVRFPSSLHTHTARERRKTKFGDSLYVSDGAIDHDSSNSAILCGHSENFPPDACLEESTAVDYEDIAWGGLNNGVVQRQIVSRTSANSESSTGKEACSRGRLQLMGERTMFALSLIQRRGAQSLESFHGGTI